MNHPQKIGEHAHKPKKQNEEVVETGEQVHEHLEQTHIMFHHLLRGVTEHHQNLEHAVKTIPFVAYAMDAVLLGYNIYKNATDRFRSKKTKAISVGTSVAQAGLLAGATGLTIATAVTAGVTAAATAAAGAIVYTTFCAVRAARSIVSAVDAYRRIRNPAHHLARKEAKCQRVDQEIERLTLALKADEDNPKKQKALEQAEEKRSELQTHIDILKNPDAPENRDGAQNLKKQAAKEARQSVYDAVMSSATAVGIGLLIAGGLPGVVTLMTVGAVGIVKNGIERAAEGYRNYRIKNLLKADEGKSAENLLKRHLSKHYADDSILTNQRQYEKHLHQFTKGLEPHEAQQKMHEAILKEDDLDNHYHGANKIKQVGRDISKWALSGDMFKPVKGSNFLSTALLTGLKWLRAIITTPIALLAGGLMYAVGSLGNSLKRLFNPKPKLTAETKTLPAPNRPDNHDEEDHDTEGKSLKRGEPGVSEGKLLADLHGVPHPDEIARNLREDTAQIEKNTDNNHAEPDNTTTIIATTAATASEKTDSHPKEGMAQNAVSSTTTSKKQTDENTSTDTMHPHS